MNFLCKISLNPNLNRSYQINLPPSFLQEITENLRDIPLFFKIQSVECPEVFFFGSVLEFTCEENFLEVPYFVSEQVGICENDILQVKLIKNVLKAKYIKLEPQSETFFQIKDYEKLLENHLSYYSILYKNQFVFLELKENQIEVLKVSEIEPDWDNINYTDFNTDNQDCFNILNTDVNTDIYNRFAVERYKKDKEIQEQELKLMKDNDFNALKCGQRLSYSNCTSDLTIENIRMKRIQKFNLLKKNES